MKPSQLTFMYPAITKIAGIVLIVFALAGLAYRYYREFAFDFAIPSQLISLGLIFIFFSRDKIDDERIHQFKFRALTAGFFASYMWLYAFNYFGHSLSAYDFVVLALGLATVIFYYMRYKL